MAKLTGIPGSGKGPALTKNLIYQVDRGQLKVQSWPRKRGKPKSPITREQNEWFKQANLMAKYAPWIDQWMAIRLSKGGPWYPRDLLMSAMKGRLFEVLILDGVEYRSVAVNEDVSSDLDFLAGSVVGTIIVRGPSLWQGLVPGPAGEVLSSQGPAAMPEWAPGGARIIARASRTSNLTLSATTTTPIPWQQTVFDDSGMWDAGDPERLTLPSNAGHCIVTGNAQSTGNGTGTRIGWLQRNGSDIVARQNNQGTGNLGISLTTGIIDFAADDYFELLLWSSVGITLEAIEASNLNIQIV